jgi:hypothetical protein
VRECANKVCPTINPVKKKEPWEDERLQKQMKELRAASTNAEIRRLQKSIKEMRRHLKNEYYREMAEHINTAAEARQVEKEN